MERIQGGAQRATSEKDAERAPFATSLRAEYDPHLLDHDQRRQHGEYVSLALRAAGVWPDRPRILDVGCGSGLLLSALGADARWRVGCDVRRNLYLQAGAPQVTFVQGSAGNLPFKDASFDLVICLAVIGEVPEWRAALDDMARCIAPGGVLYVTVANSRFLLPLYRVAKRLGRAVPESFIAYAQACARIVGRPEEGFGAPSLRLWKSTDVTPYLATTRLGLAAALPSWLIRPVASRLAPSLGCAWRRPL